MVVYLNKTLSNMESLSLSLPFFFSYFLSVCLSLIPTSLWLFILMYLSLFLYLSTPLDGRTSLQNGPDEADYYEEAWSGSESEADESHVSYV
jgi:hypothetical protein